MKKLVSIVLVLATLLAFASCGKSEKIKNAEAQIATLTENSSYKEIYDVFQAYTAVEYDKREKIENIDVLAKYINAKSSECEFLLTDEMIDEINAYFDEDIYGLRLHSSLNLDLTVKKHGTVYGKDWDKLGDYNIKSGEKTDDYTYTKYGRVVIVDKYGKKSTHDFEVDCTMEYDAEKETYKISLSSNIHN